MKKLKDFIKKTGAKRLIFCGLNILLLIVAAVCFIRINALSNLLDSQHEAERWRGESEREYAQISCFVPVNESFTLDNVAAFRESLTTRLHEAALDIDTEDILFVDAWSTTDKVSVSSALGKGDVAVTAVGGEFFSFHPITLVSGNYITSSDLMKDRVLLDEDTAWLLFGGTDIQGMSFKINGVPFVVAGVVEREQDFASKKAYTDGMGIFMSFDGYSALMSGAYSTDTDTSDAEVSTASASSSGSAVSIQCYELVMPNPVKNFALNFVKEKFPVTRSEFVNNTERFTLSGIFATLKAFDERSMQSSGVLYPYWENAARVVEDRASLLLAAAIAALVIPVIAALVLIVKYAALGKRKLEEDVFPDVKDKAEEAVRVRARRRWEKKHESREAEEK